MYTFPIIKNISDVLPAIAGREEFIIADRPGFKVVNYLVQFETTFEDPNEPGISDQEKLHRTIRRECRGIIFCDKTGNIIRRPFNKFFNLNEKAETRTENVNIALPHVILDKLDGSFIAPFVVDDKLIYGTKMGWTHVTDQVNEFLKDKENYHQFSRYLINGGLTPIFEFTSPANRIVISYKETNLTLLGVRAMDTGDYIGYRFLKEHCDSFNIPLVRALPGNIENMETFVSNTRALQGEEGYVIRFDGGLQIKMKADEYVLKHKVKDSISQEKNLVELIFLDKMDDVYSTLDKEDADKVRQYADSVMHTVSEIVQKINNIVTEQKPLLNN
jgi:RNA ligase